MKKYLRSSLYRGNVEYYSIDIAAVLNSVPIQSSDEIEYRPNLSEDKQLTDEQFGAYKNFIRTILSVIVKRDFKIVDKYQSPESYSFYVEFEPKFFDGMTPEFVLGVKFRLSDHYQVKESNSTKDLDVKNKTSDKFSGTIFSDFVVDGVSQDGLMATIKTVTQICDDLMCGDYNNLISHSS